MYHISNLFNNDDIKVLDSKGSFSVIEYQRDLSVTPESAIVAYYCNAMNIRKRQVVCVLNQSSVVLQAGAMQWMAGDVSVTTGI